MSVQDNPVKREVADLEPTGAGGVVPMPATVPATGRGRRQWLARLTHNRKATLGASIFAFMVLVAVFAPLIAPGDPNAFVARPHQAPSREHVFGTSGSGQDVFTQIVRGVRISLGTGIAVGLMVTLIGTALGMVAGYVGGRVDDVISLIINIFLVIPSLPLLVTLAAFLPPHPITIMWVLAATGWAWPARVLRSQTLSLREKDFVSASLVAGEGSGHIVFREILPNMTSLVMGSFIGSTTYAIGAEAGLEFLGLGNPSVISWGTILFWAQNNAGLLTGAWWTFTFAGLCIAITAFALSMINYAMDEITNPRLRAEKETANVLKKRSLRAQRATPVVRRATS